MLRPRRGIDVVRNTIKQFAQSKVTLPPGRHKVVILDEADRCSFPAAPLFPCSRSSRLPACLLHAIYVCDTSARSCKHARA